MQQYDPQEQNERPKTGNLLNRITDESRVRLLEELQETWGNADLVDKNESAHTYEQRALGASGSRILRTLTSQPLLALDSTNMQLQITQEILCEKLTGGHHCDAKSKKRLASKTVHNFDLTTPCKFAKLHFQAGNLTSETLGLKTSGVERTMMFGVKSVLMNFSGQIGSAAFHCPEMHDAANRFMSCENYVGLFLKGFLSLMTLNTAYSFKTKNISIRGVKPKIHSYDRATFIRATKTMPRLMACVDTLALDEIAVLFQMSLAWPSMHVQGLPDNDTTIYEGLTVPATPIALITFNNHAPCVPSPVMAPQAYYAALVRTAQALGAGNCFDKALGMVFGIAPFFASIADIVGEVSHFELECPAPQGGIRQIMGHPVHKRSNARPLDSRIPTTAFLAADNIEGAVLFNSIHHLVERLGLANSALFRESWRTEVAGLQASLLAEFGGGKVGRENYVYLEICNSTARRSLPSSERAYKTALYRYTKLAEAAYYHEDDDALEIIKRNVRIQLGALYMAKTAEDSRAAFCMPQLISPGMTSGEAGRAYGSLQVKQFLIAHGMMKDKTWNLGGLSGMGHFGVQRHDTTDYAQIIAASGEYLLQTTGIMITTPGKTRAGLMTTETFRNGGPNYPLGAVDESHGGVLDAGQICDLAEGVGMDPANRSSATQAVLFSTQHATIAPPSASAPDIYMSSVPMRRTMDDNANDFIRKLPMMPSLIRTATANAIKQHPDSEDVERVLEALSEHAPARAASLRAPRLEAPQSPAMPEKVVTQTFKTLTDQLSIRGFEMHSPSGEGSLCAWRAFDAIKNPDDAMDLDLFQAKMREAGIDSTSNFQISELALALGPKRWPFFAAQFVKDESGGALHVTGYGTLGLPHDGIPVFANYGNHWYSRRLGQPAIKPSVMLPIAPLSDQSIEYTYPEARTAIFMENLDDVTKVHGLQLSSVGSIRLREAWHAGGLSTKHMRRAMGKLASTGSVNIGEYVKATDDDIEAIGPIKRIHSLSATPAPAESQGSGAWFVQREDGAFVAGGPDHAPIVAGFVAEPTCSVKLGARINDVFDDETEALPEHPAATTTRVNALAMRARRLAITPPQIQ